MTPSRNTIRTQKNNAIQQNRGFSPGCKMLATEKTNFIITT